MESSKAEVEVPGAGDHGGDGPAIAKALGVEASAILDLSKTLNPFAPNVATLAVRHLESLRHYPNAIDATAAAACALEVPANRLLLTNGCSEAISLVATELGGRPACEPDFGLYPRSGSGPRWRSDPHNPTGVLASNSDVADIWDEAFYPLSVGRWSSGRSPILLGSFTKVFACPGLRLGYIICDDVARFARHQPEWSVGSLALALLPELLELADLQAWCRRIATARQHLVDVLNQRNYPVRSTDAPWVLVYAPGLRTSLAHQGVLVRDCSNFSMPGWVRIAVPDEEGLQRLEDALDSLESSLGRSVTNVALSLIDSNDHASVTNS